MKDSNLWHKIKSFQLDDPESQLTFSEKLAKENSWSKNYAESVIEEYKKFVYLSCIAPGGLTPSKPVDIAWHLHLTYTKSYWEDLCEKVLKKKLHHKPSRGGSSEDEKHSQAYNYLFNVYNREFKNPPPGNIWPSKGRGSVRRKKKKRAFSAPLAIVLLYIVLIAAFSIHQYYQDSFSVKGFVLFAALIGIIFFVIILTDYLRRRKIMKERAVNDNYESQCAAFFDFSSFSSDDGDGGDGCASCGGD